MSAFDLTVGGGTLGALKRLRAELDALLPAILDRAFKGQL